MNDALLSQTSEKAKTRQSGHQSNVVSRYIFPCPLPQAPVFYQAVTVPFVKKALCEEICLGS